MEDSVAAVKSCVVDLLPEVEFYFRETKIEKPGWRKIHEQLIHLWGENAMQCAVDYLGTVNVTNKENSCNYNNAAAPPALTDVLTEAMESDVFRKRAEAEMRVVLAGFDDARLERLESLLSAAVEWCHEGRGDDYDAYE